MSNLNSVFDVETNYLTVPKIRVGSEIYEDVRFLHTGNLNFEGIDYTSVTTSDEPANGYLAGDVLNLGVVEAGDAVYSNLVFKNTVDLNFTLIDLQEPQPIGETSLDNRPTSLSVNLGRLRLPVFNEYIEKYNSFGWNPASYSYLDIDLDGDDDIFTVAIYYPETGGYTIDNYGSMPAEIWINDNGTFTLKTDSYITDNPLFRHARKAITGDFNGDHYPDIIVADHGFDADPFPGDYVTAIMSNIDGTYSSKVITDIGFYHGVSSGDFDNDGDIDLFTVGNSSGASRIHSNDGFGNFTELNLLTEYDNANKQHFNTEAGDVDGDGLTDIIAIGHAWESDSYIYYQGDDGFNTYEAVPLPYIEGYGTINDVGITDVNQDGISDLIFSATGSGDNFYKGKAIYYVLMNADRTPGELVEIYKDDTFTDEWIPFITVEDINGDGFSDIQSSNSYYDLQILNNGAGSFVL